MQHKSLRFGKGFRVVLTQRTLQAAQMVIAPGGREGGEDNRHRGADQWLFVVAGSGLATVEGKTQKLKAGSLLLIPRNQRHEIRNTGRTVLKTLNFYDPPAYDAAGEPLRAGKPAG